MAAATSGVDQVAGLINQANLKKRSRASGRRGHHADEHGTALDRFWSQVDVGNSPAGCWRWLGNMTSHGYARMVYDRREIRVSRLIYEATFGALPGGHHIDHLCRTRWCVNPLHLEAVLPGENVRRGLLPVINRWRIQAKWPTRAC